MLELRDARFLQSSVDPRARPEPRRPEIAFVGRSNVGKSSLLNALTRRKRLALTSRTPGKTQTINYFLVDGGYYFVDLPGYGYARVPESVRRRWRPMIEGYLSDNPWLRGVVLLVDGRHPPTALDKEMAEWLAGRGVPALVVLTKADRVARGKREPGMGAAVEELGVDPEQAVWFSAHSGEGRDDLVGALKDLLEEA